MSGYAEMKKVSVMLPNEEPTVVDIPSSFTWPNLISTLKEDTTMPNRKQELSGVLRVRAVWKLDGSPSVQEILACPPADLSMPLLDQVHAINEDGSVCSPPVVAASFARRGGSIFVHVQDANDLVWIGMRQLYPVRLLNNVMIFGGFSCFYAMCREHTASVQDVYLVSSVRNVSKRHHYGNFR
ncbi:MAG: hypothetical protein EOP06_05815 [Proteobacteria bacterium]|nr:MAG: hypothetical protein EOP06_05815 [Pseudomonadota bacterium]